MRSIGLIAAALTLLLAGCSAQRPATTAIAGKERIPSTPVEDLDGGIIPLSSLVPARRPIVLWVWGPG